MVIKNNEDSAVKMMYKGIWYELEAGESKDLSEDVCFHWKTIHGFLSVSKSTPIVEETKSTTEAPSEEAVDPEGNKMEDKKDEKEKEVEEKSTSKEKSNK